MRATYNYLKLTTFLIEKNVWFVNFFLFVLFMFLNTAQPLIVDDLCRGAMDSLKNHTILQNIWTDYFQWTGRISAQWLVFTFFNQSFEIWQIPILNVLNSLMLVIFLHYTYKIIAKEYFFWNYLLWIVGFLWLGVFSGFLQNALWKTVGLQYFWGIVLLVYLVYRCFFSPKKTKENFWTGMVCLLSGIFIGLYNEIFTITVTIFSMFLWVSVSYFKLSEQKLLKRDFWLFSVSNFIAGCVCIIAPGNSVRKENFIEPEDVLLRYPTIFKRCFLLMQKILLEHPHFVILIILTLCLIFWVKKNNSIQKKANLF